MKSEKSRITVMMDKNVHSEIEQFTAYRKSLKIQKDSKLPSSLGGVLQEAVEMFLNAQKKKGWETMT